MDYVFISKDTLNHVSLHDCFVDKIKFENKNLVFYMSHMEILDTHPDNTYGVAKTTDEGLLIFYDYYIVEIKLCDDGLINNSESEFLEVFKNIEILATKITGNQQDGLIIHFTVDRHCTNNIIGEFIIKCKSIDICWNVFEKDSWFVNWGSQKE